MTQSMLRRLQDAKFLGFYVDHDHDLDWRDANAFNNECEHYDQDDSIVFTSPWG